MRRWVTLGATAGVALVLSAGCARSEPPRPNELVIRLGGDAPSLSQRLGLRIPPARRPALPGRVPGQLPPRPGPQPGVDPDPRRDPRPEPQRDHQQVPGPDPQRDAPLRSVTLDKGQNLYRLAAEHLGDGNRWREVMVLNGWTEDEMANLHSGTRVRLPAR